MYPYIVPDIELPEIENFPNMKPPEDNSPDNIPDIKPDSDILHVIIPVTYPYPDMFPENEPEPGILNEPDKEPISFEPKENENKKIHTLGGNDEDDNIGGGNGFNPTRNTGTSSDRNVNPTTPTTRVYNNPFSNNDDDEDYGITSYVRDSADTQTLVRHKVKTEQDKAAANQQEMLRRQRLSSLNMNFRSISQIEELENQPAYKRMGVNVFNNNEEQQLSSYSSNREKGLRESNSFLHDNVD